MLFVGPKFDAGETSKLKGEAKTTRTRQVKSPTLRVLAQFSGGAARPAQRLWHSLIAQPALSKGTIYPMLARLERKGWLRGEEIAGLRMPSASTG
jgi:hypothetical protein